MLNRSKQLNLDLQKESYSLDDNPREETINHSSAYHMNNVCSLSFKKKKWGETRLLQCWVVNYLKLSETSIELEYASDVH